MFETMKTNFEQRLTTLEKTNASLSATLSAKEIEIQELKEAKETQAKAIEQHDKIQKVVDNHQNFLEKTDSFRRECNVVVYGLPENEDIEDAEQIKELLQVMECPDTVPEKYIRLGKTREPTVETESASTNEDNTPRSPPPRPLLVVCKSRHDKADILTKTKNLAAVEKFKKVYVKKDQTPHERKEWTRLREILKREKARPTNAGMSVKIDYRSKSVMVGDRVVEKGNFRRGPEW